MSAGQKLSKWFSRACAKEETCRFLDNSLILYKGSSSFRSLTRPTLCLSSCVSLILRVLWILPRPASCTPFASDLLHLWVKQGCFYPHSFTTNLTMMTNLHSDIKFNCFSKRQNEMKHKPLEIDDCTWKPGSGQRNLPAESLQTEKLFIKQLVHRLLLYCFLLCRYWQQSISMFRMVSSSTALSEDGNKIYPAISAVHLHTM